MLDVLDSTRNYFIVAFLFFVLVLIFRLIAFFSAYQGIQNKNISATRLGFGHLNFEEMEKAVEVLKESVEAL